MGIAGRNPTVIRAERYIEIEFDSFNKVSFIYGGTPTLVSNSNLEEAPPPKKKVIQNNSKSEQSG